MSTQPRRWMGSSCVHGQKGHSYRDQGARVRGMAVLDAMLGKLCATPRPVAVLNLFEQSDGAPKGAVHTQQSVNVCRKWARCKFLPGGARDGHKVSRPWIAERDATEFRRATRVAALSRQARGRSGGARRKWVLPRRGHGRSSASWGFSWSIFGPE